MNEKLTFLMEFKDKATAQIKKVKSETKGITDEVKKMKKETGTSKGMFGSFANLGKKAFKGVGDSAKKTFAGIRNGASKAFNGLKSVALSTTGIVGGALAAIGVGAFAKDVLQVGMGFDKVMSEVQAISGATGKDLDDLRQKAKDLGASTAFSASDAAGALKELSMAGFDVNQSMDAIDNTLMLAAASGLELADAAGFMTSTMAQFGLEGKEASKMVADQLSKAATSAKTDVAGLGEGLKYVGASAKASKIPLEDTLATLGMLNDAGIEGLKYMAGPTRLEIAC